MTLVQVIKDPVGTTATLTDQYGQDHEFSSNERGTPLIRHVRPHQIASLCRRQGWHALKCCPVMYPGIVPT